MRAILVRLFLWPFCGYKKKFCSVLSAMQASGDVMPDACHPLCLVTPLGSK